MKKYIALLLWIAGLLVLSSLSGVSKGHAADIWYATLNRSPLNPPDIVFPIVWSVLYVMIAVVGWMIWNADQSLSLCREKVLYILQLVVNLSWMPIFFYFHVLGLSFFIIVLLVVLVGWLIISLLYKRKAISFWLLPYFIWICFATYLNYFILVNN